MSNMFFDCINLEQINLSHFITDNVNNILLYINLPQIFFNKLILI